MRRRWTVLHAASATPGSSIAVTQVPMHYWLKFTAQHAVNRLNRQAKLQGATDRFDVFEYYVQREL